MKIRRVHRRNGLTLLEVVVAMAIFLISLGAIYQLVSLGSDRAMDVKQQARTSLRCQSKLNEIIVGAQEMSTTGSYTNVSDDAELPQLQWKMEASQSPVTNLWDVKVFVKTDLPTGRTIESQLCQMVLDPSVRGSTLDRPNPTPAGTPTPDSTTPAASSAPAPTPAPAAKAPAPAPKAPAPAPKAPAPAPKAPNNPKGG